MKSSASAECLVMLQNFKKYYLEKYFKSHKLNCIEYLKSSWVNVKDKYCACKYYEFVIISVDTLFIIYLLLFIYCTVLYTFFDLPISNGCTSMDQQK
jgi:hypothetical protein